MGDRTGGRPGAAEGAVTADSPASVRNVAFVGHSGAGKTTLVEALALTTGAVPRAGRVEDGDTVSDHDGIERRQHRSVRLSLVPVAWRGHKVNLLDTPGHADFAGELRAGLRAADAALFVVSAAQNPEVTAGATRSLWEECEAAGVPRALVVTHLESARGGFEETARLCAEVFGGDDPDAVVPLQSPVRGAPGPDGHAPVTGLLDLLSGRLADYAPGTRVESAPDPAAAAAARGAREALIEAVISGSEDEDLMERYLDGADLGADALLGDLERAVASGALHPVLAAAPAASGARQGLGTVELLDLVTAGLPAPPERPAPAVATPSGRARADLGCDPDGPLVAEVVSTGSDRYAGRVSLVRVFSGTLRPDQVVHLSGRGLAGRERDAHDADVRTGGLTSPFGERRLALPYCVAGDLACVSRLDDAETGDTLSAPGDPLVVAPWEPPEALLPVAVRAHGGADGERLSSGLARLAAEDPAVRTEHDGATGQLVLWCVGEAHAEVVLERLRDRYGARVDVVPHEVALRETFAGRAEGLGRHVKQSGGHGQFAVCAIEVEPLPGGSGIEFVDGTVGGSVPRQFVASVEKGVRAQAAKGVVDGRPLTDVRITLRDGKAHAVDSSDAAFQTAGALALREAAGHAPVRLLEPVAEVRVLVGDDYVGPVLGDLTGRRGRVTGTEREPGGRTLVRAEVPEREIERYAVELRVLAHGTARFSRAYARHEPVPRNAVERVGGGRR
ncbi:elongation factor G-like protein EF-G2 [Streptomyces sp. JNUCC 64]